MSEKLLELKNVTIKFGGITALNEVNFHVNKGEICALIGPNGAGKTTVFNVVTGVYPITSGEITFKGENLAGKKRHQVTKIRPCSYIPECSSLRRYDSSRERHHSNRCS